MRYKLILFSLIVIDLSILYFQTSTISISSAEASILYGKPSFLQYIVEKSILIFGQNDFALRLPMIIFHISSIILMYKISQTYIKSYKNRLWLIFLFILLPGVVSSAIIVNDAGVLIFGLLLFIYLYEHKHKYIYLALLLLFSFINGGFVYLYISLVFYYMNKKKFICVPYMIVLISISLYIHGSGIFGLPKGHFLDVIGVYSAIFTPIIFIYLTYTIYRKYLTKDIDIVWYIASTAFIISLILSFRQRVSLEYFAPYLMVALPLSAKIFISSYRVRLKKYRTPYKLAFTFSLIFLILNTLAVFLNKYMFLYIENPQKHFAYNSYVAKELALELKNRKFNCIKTDEEMQLRLKFYKIEKCNKNLLKKVDIMDEKNSNVTISYMNRIVYRAYVTKLNNK